MSGAPGKGGSLLKNFFSQSLLQVANNLLPLLSIPIIVRIIGPDKFGVINFATVVMSYFILLTNYGFDLTATRAVALHRTDNAAISNLFNEVLFAKLLLFGVSTLLFLVLLRYMPQLAQERKVALYSFILVFSFVLTPTWLYQGMQELYNMAIFNFVTKLLFTVAVLLVIREKADYVWQPFMIGVAHVLVGVIAFWWAVRRYRIRLAWVPLRTVLRHLWNERTIFFSFVSINVYIYASTLILGLVQGPEDVAYFSSSYRLVNIMHTIVTIPLGMSLFPYIAESFAVGREEGVGRVRVTAPFVFYATLLMGIGVWLLAPWIITIFYGPAFRPAIGVLRILCFLPVALGLGNLAGVQTMVNLKMDKAYSAIIVIGSLIGVGLSFWLASRYSYIGGAWALLGTEVLLGLIMWGFLERKRLHIFKLAYFHPAYLLGAMRPLLERIRNRGAKRVQPQPPALND